MFGNTISCEERVENRFRYQSGKTSKNGYEYLDDQLGSLKDKVKINQYQSAESVNDLWEARGYKSPYKEKTVVQNKICSSVGHADIFLDRYAYTPSII